LASEDKKEINRKMQKRIERNKKRNLDKKKNKDEKDNLDTEDNLDKKDNLEKKEIGTYLEIAGFIAVLIIGLLVAQHMNVVISGSMEPTFYRGDIVIIQKTSFFGINEFNPEDVKVGEVVVYNAKWYDEGPVIHRVINKTKINGSTYFIIKGDHNPVPDKYPVEPSRITARVVTIGDTLLIIPKIGYITIWLKGL